ncbi:unnamed protein product [Jaminaea pallidilutea]
MPPSGSRSGTGTGTGTDSSGNGNASMNHHKVRRSISSTSSSAADTSASSSTPNPYSAPTGVTSSLVPDGKLIDHDTAEVTALPPTFLNTKSNFGPSATGDYDPIGSRPGSSLSLRGVHVDKASDEAIKRRSLYSHPPSEDHGDARSNVERLFAHRAGAPPYGEFTLYRRFRFAITQLIANTLSSVFLILVVIWALSVRFLAQFPRIFSPAQPEVIQEWDDPDRWGKEGLVKDVRYYARSCGFDIVNETVETADGYFLRVNRIICPERAQEKHTDGKGGFPILIMHGLFQSSGSFVTSEDRSLAFWLARHGGYQVFLGNNRGVFDMGHKKLSRSDPRFWDYNIRELACYDLPALVDHVRKETGYDKIGYIGHSQGNGTAFISLSKGMVPELGEKLSYFGALAPAVFAGPLTSCFPFTTLATMEWSTWKRFFGVLDFIPLMKMSYDWTPAYPYALLGYQMFAFLFCWTDACWLKRRKSKMFRFTPQPVSSTSIYWWTGKGGFSSRGCILDPGSDKWWDQRFPPLSIYSGGMDFLVLTDPLIERLETIETDVRVVRYKRQEEAEHCDHFWAADAVEWCFHDILEDIESTRPLYPEEKANGGRRVMASARADKAVEETQEEHPIEIENIMDQP